MAPLSIHKYYSTITCQKNKIAADKKIKDSKDAHICKTKDCTMMSRTNECKHKSPSLFCLAPPFFFSWLFFDVSQSGSTQCTKRQTVTKRRKTVTHQNELIHTIKAITFGKREEKLSLLGLAQIFLFFFLQKIKKKKSSNNNQQHWLDWRKSKSSLDFLGMILLYWFC